MILILKYLLGANINQIYGGDDGDAFEYKTCAEIITFGWNYADS